MKKNQDGYLLISVLLVLVILMIFGTAAFVIASNEVKQARVYDHGIQAYTYSISGIEIARVLVEGDEDFRNDLRNSTTGNHGASIKYYGNMVGELEDRESDIDNKAYELIFEPAGDSKTKVTSIGFFGNQTYKISSVITWGSGGSGEPSNGISELKEKINNARNNTGEGYNNIFEGNLFQGDDRSYTANSGVDLVISDRKNDFTGNQTYTLTAPEIWFRENSHISNAQVIIKTQFVYFHEQVTGPNSGFLQLCFEPYGGNPYGYVYFNVPSMLRTKSGIQSFHGLYRFNKRTCAASEGERLDPIDDDNNDNGIISFGPYQ